ncbi:P-loop containing nucleoside triphosphate hydrolase protein [Vararia minispora EC-137]|uniref:P-loop containing nucleoside triphosphate hydrolase protein n=1 Tax=Vararia minispora EC-137 TaxID=1314806 RepID=A0ACB8QEL3_9AGAM|nr:P-loop containing nucleoside triphosphate hydrolase protein [Vararia minispora EC-137]
MTRLLFPASSDVKPSRRLVRAETGEIAFEAFDPLIAADEQQVTAVLSIMYQEPGSPPFIIYGPPGTGKTATIVEAVLQLLSSFREDGPRVLLCAPSNFATDLLTYRLANHGVTPADMLRLNAITRDRADGAHNDIIRPYCVTNDDDDYIFPVLADVLRVRIVVATCGTASVLQALCVPRTHFTHVFIDEAGYADEPTAMVPIRAVAGPQTNVILAGDPNQLRPVVFSHPAAMNGLSISYLERLMVIKDVYGLDKQMRGQRTLSMLITNRRSHQAIIRWSNKLLYDSALRARAPRKIVSRMLDSPALPNPAFPIVFHGQRGNENRMRKGSVYNEEEAKLVRTYCKQLTEDRERPLRPDEIGVITPYKAQVRWIRHLLKSEGLEDVSVGSVEQYQGQERAVIIISLVRSNAESNPLRSMGFIDDDRRMNVAFTRAMSMLVVIGDPAVLHKSRRWHSFLSFVYTNGGCKGEPIRGEIEEQEWAKVADGGTPPNMR